MLPVLRMLAVAESTCSVHKLIAAAGGQVLLTREAGKNAELLRRLSREGIDAVEVPMLETADGPDRRVSMQGCVKPST